MSPKSSIEAPPISETRYAKYRSLIIKILALGIALFAKPDTANMDYIQPNKSNKPPMTQKIPTPDETAETDDENLKGHEAIMDIITKNQSLSKQAVIDILADTKFKDREEKIEVAGDPKVGTIIMLRQVHKNPNNDGSPSPSVAAYQARMFEEMGALKPRHIFEEGFPRSVKNFEDLLAWQNLKKEDSKTQEMLMVAQLFFNTELEEYRKSLNAQQQAKRLELLKQWDSTTSYVMGNQPRVGIQGLVTKSALKYKKLLNRLNELEDHKMVAELISNKHVKKIQKEIDLLNAEMEDLNAKREKEMVDIIMAFLRQNPGETVLLVLGADHQLDDDIKAQKNPPVLKSIVYPKLAADNWIEIMKSLD